MAGWDAYRFCVRHTAHRDRMEASKERKVEVKVVTVREERRGDPVAHLGSVGAVAVMRLRHHRLTLEVAKALFRGGIEVMEVTVEGAGAFDALAGVVETLGDQALVGAGTVTSVADVEQAAAVGARFCVSPNTDPAVIKATLDAGLLPLPGAATPTEVGQCLQAGATVIKLFPAGPLGLAYLRALRGPYRHVSFVPTGGITHDRVGEWLDAGAFAVGLGSDLVPGDVGADDLPGIEQRAARVVEQVTARRDRRASVS